jgi:hypothetical protein
MLENEVYFSEENPLQNFLELPASDFSILRCGTRSGQRRADISS